MYCVHSLLHRDSKMFQSKWQNKNIARFKLVLNLSSVLLLISLSQFVFLLRHTYKTFCFDLNNVNSKWNEVSFEILTFFRIFLSNSSNNRSSTSTTITSGNGKRSEFNGVIKTIVLKQLPLKNNFPNRIH